MSEFRKGTIPEQCNRRVKNFIEVSDLLDQNLPQTSQQRVKKIIQLEGSEEFLSNDQMPSQATKSEATIIRSPHQRLKNITEIQDLNICNIVSPKSVNH